MYAKMAGRSYLQRCDLLSCCSVCFTFLVTFLLFSAHIYGHFYAHFMLTFCSGLTGVCLREWIPRTWKSCAAAKECSRSTGRCVS